MSSISDLNHFSPISCPLKETLTGSSFGYKAPPLFGLLGGPSMDVNGASLSICLRKNRLMRNKVGSGGFIDPGRCGTFGMVCSLQFKK
jgi:hypothetical protein